MIVISEGVWRAECIAAIDIDKDENEIQIFPLNCSEYVPYEFEDENEAVETYKRIVTQWKGELEKNESRQKNM